MDKYNYDDINYIIINDNINYKYNIVKKGKNITSKMGIQYFKNIRKVKFKNPDNIKNPKYKTKKIWFNPAHYISSKEFLQNNNFIPFMNLKNIYYHKIHTEEWHTITEFINSILFEKMLKYIFKYNKKQLNKCFTGSVALNNLLKIYNNNNNLSCFEDNGIINKNKMYDFIQLNYYEWNPITEDKIEKTQYKNLIKYILNILNNLNKNGNAILFTISMFNNETKNLIHIITSMFQYVFITKPHVQHHTYHCYLICINYNMKNKSELLKLINKLDINNEMIDIENKSDNNYIKNEIIFELYNNQCFNTQKKYLKLKKFDKDEYLKELINFYSYHIPQFEISEYYINKVYFKKINSFIKDNNLFYNFYDENILNNAIDKNKEIHLLLDNYLFV